MPPGALHEKLPLMLLPRKVVQAAICVAARPRTAAPATFERGEALRRAASAPSFPASRQKAWAASSDSRRCRQARKARGSAPGSPAQVTEFLGREVPAHGRAKGGADIGPQGGGFGEAQPHIGDRHLPARAPSGGALESRKLLRRQPGHERAPLSQVIRNSFGRNPSITAPSERTMTGVPAMPFSRAKRSLASSGEVSQARVSAIGSPA